MVLSRVRLIRVRLVLVNLNPINDTYIGIRKKHIRIGNKFDCVEGGGHERAVQGWITCLDRVSANSEKGRGSVEIREKRSSPEVGFATNCRGGVGN